jgi:polyisoprenoid-binding protein YceI
MKRKAGLVHMALLALTGLAVVAAAEAPAVNPAPTTRPSHAESFKVEPRAGIEQVTVKSHYTLGSFTSRCNEVTGRFRFDRRHPETISGRFSMPVTGIHTGIRLRDHHLQSADWLDAANYPDIVITVSRAQDVRRESDNSIAMTLVGTCSMHGVTNEARIPVTLAESHESAATGAQASDVLSIRSQFEIKISDYQIKGTKKLGMKVADVQRVSVTVYASADGSGSSPEAGVSQRGRG